MTRHIMKRTKQVERFKPKDYFDPRSFRYTQPEGRPDVRILIGCKKEFWDDKNKVCKIGTEIYEIIKE